MQIIVNYLHFFFAIRKLLKQQSALMLKKQTHIHNPILKKGNEFKTQQHYLGNAICWKTTLLKKFQKNTLFNYLGSRCECLVLLKGEYGKINITVNFL